MIDTGGSAFPSPGVVMDDLRGGEVQQGAYEGMTLRDYFAASALTGFMQHQGWIGYMESTDHRQWLLRSFSRDAYAVADAMLAERAK